MKTHAPMNRTVLVTAIFFDEGANAFLKAHNCKVVFPGLGPGVADTSLSKERMFELLRDADAWIVGTAPVTREMLTSFPKLLVLAKRGVGYDQVDVAAAKELGRVVTIAPGGNGPSVADHTIALMLAAARSLFEFRERMRSGNWSVQPVTELYRKTVGLIGLGRIGRGVAQRLKGFETTILAFDEIPYQAYAAANGIRFVDLPFLLRDSDYISLHLPLTPASRHLINQAALASMKETAILVNTARGGLIDEAALLQALRAGKIGGAGLDVLLGEQDAAWRSVADELGRPALRSSGIPPGASAPSHSGSGRCSCPGIC